MDIINTCIAMVGVVILILGFRVNAVIALLIGSLYLGITTGLGVENTITTIASGFGDIMAEVGLLIGFGVLIGSLLSAMGAVQRLTQLILKLVGPRRFPYAMAVAFSTFLPSIYADVQMVLAAPLVRTAAPRLGRYGLGMLTAAQSIGMLAGYLFVVPGLVVVTVAGLVGTSLSSVLVYGFIIGPVTALLTMLVWAALLRMGLWNPDKDEEPTSEEERGVTATDDTDAVSAGTPTGAGTGTVTQLRTLPLAVMSLPVVVPLLMIASATLASVAGLESGVLSWVGNPILALFVGLVIAYLLARVSLQRTRVELAIGEGLGTMGQVLLITGVGGSLGAVIGETSLKDTLGGLFSAEAGMSVIGALCIAYLVAALLHMVIGSTSVAAIAAAGIIAPTLSQLDVPPALIVLSICAGVMFAIHVNSNGFWMFQSLMKVTMSGALKAFSLISVIGSLVAFALVLLLALVV